MKFKILILLFLFNFSFSNSINKLCDNIRKNGKFDKIVIWGHKLHSHTHSYIHWAFFRSFEFLGYKTYWFDNGDDIKNFNFNNSLFITEGQVDQKIPLRKDCFYILHNCYDPKYQILKSWNNFITLQVYTKDCENRNLTRMEDYVLYNINDRIIHMPWATDLLPHEINRVTQNIKLNNKNKVAYYIGSVGGGVFGNINEISPFIAACEENNIKFKVSINKSMEDNINLIQNAILAPAIQGIWQLDNGYIPCRIFKNISYGQFGITNSETVYKLFNKKILYNTDTYKLCYEALDKAKKITQEELRELINFVRDNHTYLNRIDCLFKFITLVKEQ